MHPLPGSREERSTRSRSTKTRVVSRISGTVGSLPSFPPGMSGSPSGEESSWPLVGAKLDPPWLQEFSSWHSLCVFGTYQHDTDLATYLSCDICFIVSVLDNILIVID